MRTAATNLVLGCADGGYIPGTRKDGQFEFMVETNGVYALRLLQYERAGDAFAEWYWVNRTNGVKTLIRPFVLESAVAVTGPYAADAAAQINPATQTITVPRSGGARFYRLRSSIAYTINKVALSGGNVVLTYQ